ncbi:DUF72 domain-containing protein [Muricauda sp. 2012CJ35-5]|uniref:DUF72 domain-containing protein n=1 Tax=Flagellimonas spongiicola TaxID=2942208 RepID=A0ABT0PPV4_9FLAO|nr:DUF72 domain-containing protein [Allomuricauda spongiicola]MCL6273428.1 DUF72 domain-containing protein [Allomuricauda spongiicola]
MKFGKVEHPELIDFTMPLDHPDTERILSRSNLVNDSNFYIGCAKWNRQDLKNFYPRGTKDELVYYASQFNSIELNATFYRIFPPDQYQKWYDRTPANFRFFPKMINRVSHLRRLNDKVYEITDRYLEVTTLLREKMGTIFLQLHGNFGPKNWDRVERYVNYWPKEIPLAMEFRHKDWYADNSIAGDLYYLLKENNIAHVLVDTAGRRDLMHMRLSNNEAFVRYVGANHPTDYDRLDDWITRLQQWKSKGLTNIHFFVHQNLELESPLLSAYLIEKLNRKLDAQLVIPNTL